MKKDNIEMLAETLRYLNQGWYDVGNKRVRLKLSKRQMEASHVLLPDDVKNICSRELRRPAGNGKCEYACVRADSYAAAIDMTNGRGQTGKDSMPVLVLNFANPVNIGGGVYKGSNAQEEDLCRKSSLLRSLENSHAYRYYEYNRGLRTHMGSNAMIFSPEVEVIRDEHGELLNETAVVSVLTCAAPMISYDLEGMSEDEYRSMFYDRISDVLKCAAYFGYDHLVLGAWGCGAFGNDAGVVSDLFYKALKELRWNELREGDLFRKIVFAVRSGDPPSYNYLEFYRNFGGDHFYRG